MEDQNSPSEEDFEPQAPSDSSEREDDLDELDELDEFEEEDDNEDQDEDEDEEDVEEAPRQRSRSRSGRSSRPKRRSQAEAEPSAIASFFKEDLLAITKRYFAEPITGIQSLVKNSSPAAPQEAIILMLVGGVLSTGVFLMLGPDEIEMEFSGYLKATTVFIIFMLIMTVISFAIKKTGGDADIKEELTTGSLFAFPTIIFAGFCGHYLESLVGLMGGDSGSDPVVFLGLFIIIFLMMVNTLLQSLRAGGVKEAIAWYLSPLGLMLGLYLTKEVTEMLLD